MVPHFSDEAGVQALTLFVDPYEWAAPEETPDRHYGEVAQTLALAVHPG